MPGGEWWRHATIYQIYPLSFADGNDDGYGDLPGIIDRLGHLAGEPHSLGVDAIWLSPIYRSPMVDFGYDIVDHCAVDPRFGSLGDAEALIRTAHRVGLRVLLDYVPNHTSDEHEWFQRSRRSRSDPLRNWYVWADPAPDGGAPNNWLSAFERVGGAWTFDAATRQYYLHSYTAQQPDLNWRNPEVRRAMHDVLRFWLDRGVDGFRVDAPHRLGKDALLRDNPLDVVDLRIATQVDDRRHRNLDDPFVHDVLRELRSVTASYPDAVLVGEVGIHHRARRLRYYGSGDELQLAFDFGFWTNSWDAQAFRASGLEHATRTVGWPTYALSNHDISRHASRYALRTGFGIDSMARARVAAVLLTTLPGTSFLYYGEEIGMTDVTVPAGLATDPNGRDPVRTPMQWDMNAVSAGFSNVRAWLPTPADGVDVVSQRGDPDSLLNLYRRLLQLRHAHPCLRSDGYEDVEAGPDVYAYRRGDGASTLLVLLNFADAYRPVAITRKGTMENARLTLSTHRRELGAGVDPHELLLAPNEAVIVDLGPSRG